MSIIFSRILTFTLSFLIVTTAVAQKNDSWTLKGTKEGVTVYYRDQAAGVQEIKLATTLETSLSGITQLLTEVELYPQWGYKIAESRVVKRVSDHEAYYYSRLDFPWPLSDRDVVMHTKLTQDPKTKVITATSTAVRGMVPVVKDVVRLEKANTRWTIKPLGAGKQSIEYYINSDPGGNLPDWLVNMAVDVGPRETIKNMRSLLAQHRYRNARLAQIVGD